MLKGSQGMLCTTWNTRSLSYLLFQVFGTKTLITQPEEKKYLKALANGTDIPFIQFAFLAC